MNTSNYEKEVMALVAQIRNFAHIVSAHAVDIAAELENYACKIESKETRPQSLQEFDRYVWHYKGLRDVMIPGMEQHEWESHVKRLSKVTAAAIGRKPLWQRLFS